MNTFAHFDIIKDDHRLPGLKPIVGMPVTDGNCQISPEKAGFDPVQLARLDSHFAGLIRSGALQSAGYLLARKGKIFAWRTLGWQNAGDTETPYAPDSIRFIASITKLFIATSVMQLWEDGKLDIHAPMATHLKEFDVPDWKNVTPFHLLTHTSGIRADEGYFLESIPLDSPWHDPRDPEWIRRFLSGPVRSAPGKEWAYSSRGFNLLAELIQRVSGQSSMDYVENHICKPLGLRDTRFSLSAAQTKRMCNTDAQWVGKRPKRRKTGPGIPAVGGSGLFSTLPDLYRMGQCMLQGGTLGKTRLMGRKTMEAMTANHLGGVPAFWWGKRAKDMPYALGLQLGKDTHMGIPTFGHEGYGSSCLFIDPVHDMVVVYFSNSTTGWTQEAVDNPRAIIWSGLE